MKIKRLLSQILANRKNRLLYIVDASWEIFILLFPVWFILSNGKARLAETLGGNRDLASQHDLCRKSNYIYNRKKGGCKIRLGSQTIPYKSISNAANELCGISLSKDMLCLLSLKFLNNKEESMEKRKGVSKLIVSILLLMILMIYIVTSVELYKAGEPERARQYYNQLINESCQATFDVASIEFGKDCSWAFQDIGYEIKCELNNPVNELEASLAQKGWNCSLFPEEMTREILSNTDFRREMYQLNSSKKSYWLYLDVDALQHGKKDDRISAFQYSTPHYLVALYIPEDNVLYYLEYSI